MNPSSFVIWNSSFRTGQVERAQPGRPGRVLYSTPPRGGLNHTFAGRCCMMAQDSGRNEMHDFEDPANLYYEVRP